MTYQLISSDQALAEYCEKISKAQALALDTEFVRTRTLYPQLGLLQVYDGQHLALIDPLEINDFSPFVALMLDANIIKILHSCSEDIEAFLHNLACVPTPIFDTQFAACILGMGATLGYAALVEQCLNIHLDKGESRTDWLARPLTDKQLEYAANDVLYLWQLYPAIKQACDERSRSQWVFDEMALLTQKKRASLPIEYAYLTVKNNWQLKGCSLAALKLLAQWRLQLAREKDSALNFVIREQAMVEIAKRLPNNKGALFAVDGLSPIDARKHGEQILAIVESAKAIEPEAYPHKVERLIDFPAYKKTLSAIRQVCIQCAEELQIPLEVLGSKKQANQLLKWLWFEQDETHLLKLKPDMLTAWRKAFLQPGLEQVLGIKLDSAEVES